MRSAYATIRCLLLEIYEILLPQFLQNFASIGFIVRQVGQSVDSRSEPHLMQCLAPWRSWAPHFPHNRAPCIVSLGLAGARALGENTSERITTSPTVAISSCETSNSLDKSLSSSRVLNCSLSTESSRDLISPESVGMAFRTLPTSIPCESTTWRPLRDSSRA